MCEYSGWSDDQLVEAVRTGDHAALGALVLRHQGRLLYYAQSWMKSEKIKDKSPEDVVQETWLLVHRKLHQYQIGTRFRAWVLRIAHNVFLGFKRGHRKSSAFPSDPADDTPPDARLNRQERANALYAAMLQLPIDQAQALYLAKVDRWTYKEIARHQDCSIHTVKKRLKHARDELRRLLGIDFDNDGELSLINTS